MTGGGQYERLSGRLLGVFRVRDSRVEGVETGFRICAQSADEVAIEPAAADPGAPWVAAVAFEYRTPDVFAPALLDFQTAIYEQYRDGAGRRGEGRMGRAVVQGAAPLADALKKITPRWTRLAAVPLSAAEIL